MEEFQMHYTMWKEQDTGNMIPFIWHLGEGRTIKREIRPKFTEASAESRKPQRKTANVEWLLGLHIRAQNKNHWV